MISRTLNRLRQPPVQVIPEKPGGLGTFGGVFTPSILTILGVIMYLRFGWVVGNVGLLGSLLIVSLSTSITLLTGFSIAAIATDQRVRVGGAYYMISRSLGIEPGGAVGIPLYLAQGLSVALYTVGFAESVAVVFPGMSEKVVGVVTTVLVAVLVLISARVAIRAQYFIMTAIALSILSLLFGNPAESTTVSWWTGQEEGFWVVFAVFFPAVTGIMAGVNMSGDLKDPGRSIPRGTFAAIGVGYLIYMAVPFILATRATPETLTEDPLIMRRMSFWGDAILLGVWGATLSSAVGSMLGAPRVLQAMARDGVLPRALAWLGRGSGPDDTPRVGTAVTLAIALVAVYLGNLNIIAPILTMFFLTTYGVLNIVAGLERLIGSPSFRPKFSVHWSFSFLGALGCIAIMFLINAFATVVAILFVLAIYIWLERQELQTTWGDVRGGIWMALTRAGLLHLRTTAEPKNWRPHILVLSGAPTKRWHLIDLASSITHNRALMSVSTVVPSASVSPERINNIELNIREYLARRGIQAFVRVISAPNPFSGAVRLVSAYGLGALIPNTILLGDSQEASHRANYCDMIAHFYRAQRNIVIVRDDENRGFGKRKIIDVWWGGLKGNGGLMMILAYLLKTSISWRNATVRLWMVVPTESAAKDARANLNEIVERIRTGAVPRVVIANGRSFDSILHESSRDADLVFLGMAEPDGNFVSYYEQLRKRTEGLPSTIFVLAAEEVAFREVLIQFEKPLVE